MSAKPRSKRLTDSTALALFEHLVQAQVPSAEPWTPVTDYSFAARRDIEGPHPELIRDVFNARLVLDVGCGKDGILVRLLRDVGVNAIGFDPTIDPATTMVGDYCSRGSILTLSGSMLPASLVICREVLEHLTVRQIAIAVRNLVALSTDLIYVTTRFHPDPTHLLDMRMSDDLDPTHITMLNQDFLRTLFVLEGCKRRADLEAKMDWKKLGRVLVYEKA